LSTRIGSVIREIEIWKRRRKYTMKVTLQQAEKILTGNQNFSRLSFSMMLTRLKMLYAKNPEVLQSCTDEINEFLDKFKDLMGVDYAIIEKL
jgi:hypothetical protein